MFLSEFCFDEELEVTITVTTLLSTWATASIVWTVPHADEVWGESTTTSEVDILLVLEGKEAFPQPWLLVWEETLLCAFSGAITSVFLNEFCFDEELGDTTAGATSEDDMELQPSRCFDKERRDCWPQPSLILMRDHGMGTQGKLDENLTETGK